MKAYLYLILSAFCFLTACGGGDSGGEKPAKDNPADREVLALDCSKITSDAEQATQGGVVTVGSDKPINHAYYLHEKDDGSTQEIEIIVRKNSDDYSIAIPYLAQLANGGKMELAVSAAKESNRCNLPVITLSALPAADKSLADDLLDQTQIMIKNYTSMLGFSDSTTKEEYQSDPLLMSAALANAYFFDPDSEISIPYLRNLISQMTDEEKTFLAQMIQDAGLIEQIKTASDNFKDTIASVDVAEGETASDKSALTNNHNQRVSISRQPITESVKRTTASDGCTNALNDPGKHRARITSLKALSAAMKLAEQARIELSKRASRDNSSKDNFLSAAGTGAAIAGGPAGAVVGLASAIPGIIGFVEEHSAQQLANLLPSSISDIDLQVIPRSSLEEDYTDLASNPFWLGRFSAKSKGLNLSKQVVDSIFTAAGALPGVPASSGIGMTGVSQVSGKVFGNSDTDGSTDCGLIIAPQSWEVPSSTGDDIYYTDKIEGSSFVLEANRKLKPVALGSSTLSVQLQPNLFPSEGASLGSLEKSIAVENLRKEYIAPSTVTIEEAGDDVTINIATLNMANVSPYSVEYGDGASKIKESVSGKNITLTVGTTTDEEKYPLSVTITSTSTNLSPTSPPRQKTIKIDVTPIKVKINKTNEVCNEDKNYEVDLEAVVENAKKDDGVEWSFEGSGGTLMPVDDNNAFFIASNTNKFTIKATSKEDPKAEDTLILNPKDCKANIFINSQSSGGIGEPNVDEGNCDATNPQNYLANEIRFGSELEFLEINPKAIKANQSALSNNSSKPWVSSIREATTATHYQQETEKCLNFSFQQSAITRGSISADDDNGVTIDQTLSSSGRCYEVPKTSDGDSGNETQLFCLQGKSTTVSQIFWIFDHKSETTYELTNDMVCTTPPLLSSIPDTPQIPNLPDLPGVPSLPGTPNLPDISNGSDTGTPSLPDLSSANANMRYMMHVFDNNGSQISPANEDELTLLWNPIHNTQCYKDNNPTRALDWKIPKFDQPATVVIQVIFNDQISSSDLDEEKTLEAEGTSQGTIRVKPKGVDD